MCDDSSPPNEGADSRAARPQALRRAQVETSGRSSMSREPDSGSHDRVTTCPSKTERSSRERATGSMGHLRLISLAQTDQSRSARPLEHCTPRLLEGAR